MKDFKTLPKSPGVYFFKNASGKIIYVGKAKSLRDRVSSYFQPPSKLLPKTAQMVAEASDLDHMVVESEIDALLLEANFIRKLAPKYNVDWKDGKAYPLIEISIKDKIPQVHFARHEINSRARYFGPYPTGSDLTGLLRFLRRIFPFVSQDHPGNKPCLRSHLGLCPCPDVFTSAQARQHYLKDLKSLMDFLDGKRQTVQRKLEKDMLQASKEQNYEKAGDIKRKLQQINFVTQNRTMPEEYEINPNLTSDRRASELQELATQLGISPPTKIECYDISNTSGKNATGAQVVFVDGEPDKNLYRRYKIHLKDSPNDFAMMAEMLSRRLKSDVALPELMIIDGGKGQLSTVVEVLQKNLSTDQLSHLTVIGLAKRLETIITTNGQEINLPESSPALHLIQRLRDEAHRFSRKYHFLLRRKKMFA